MAMSMINPFYIIYIKGAFDYIEMDPSISLRKVSFDIDM